MGSKEKRLFCRDCRHSSSFVGNGCFCAALGHRVCACNRYGHFYNYCGKYYAQKKNKHAYKLGDVFELFGKRFVVKRPHGRHSCDGCAFYPFCAADEAFAKEVESRVISCAQQIYVEL